MAEVDQDTPLESEEPEGDTPASEPGVDDPEYAEYKKSKDGFVKTHKQKISAAEAERREAEKVREKYEQRLHELNARQGRDAQPGRPDIGKFKEEYFQRWGFESADEPVTADQAFAIFLSALQEVAPKVTGTESKTAKIEEALSKVTSHVDDLSQTFGQMVADATVDELIGKYENADRDAVMHVLRTHEDDDTLQEAMEEAAKRTHERVTSLVEKRAPKRPSRGVRAAGPGTATAGKKPKSLFSQEGLVDWARRNPAASEDEAY